VPLCFYQSRVFFLFCYPINTPTSIFYISVYSILLNDVSSVHFSHHQIRQWFDKRVKGEWPLLRKSRFKVIVKLLQQLLLRKRNNKRR